MFNPFMLNKSPPTKKQSYDQNKVPKNFTGLIANPSSVSNEQFLMLIQEIGDPIDEDMDSSNKVSLENGLIQISFQFLRNLNPTDVSYLSKKDIIILLLNIEEEDANEQFNFIQDYLRQADPNSSEMKNSQLFFFVQSFNYNIHDNTDFEYQISELLTEYPFLQSCKVSQDNSQTLKKFFMPTLLSFVYQDKSVGWNPIIANEEDQEDQLKYSGNVLDQLDQYKQKRTISQSPEKKKSIFINPLVSMIKQQQEDKKEQEDTLKAIQLQEQLSSQYSIQQKSTSKVQSIQNLYESPMLSSRIKKRDASNSLIYQDSSNKKVEIDSPLSTLRYREEISDQKHQIKLKVSPFKRDILQNFTYPKLSGEKEPPIFKTSLMHGDEEDDLMQYSVQKNSNMNSPSQRVNQNSPSQFKQFKQENQRQQPEGNFIKLLDKQFYNNPIQLNENQKKQKQQSYQFGAEQKNIRQKDNQRSTTPNIKDKTTNYEIPNQKSQQLVRNKSSLGIRQSHTAQQDRPLTPNRLTQNKSQKQIISSHTTSSNCIMKLNIEVQNKIIQIEVEEHDTPHTLTYKLLQKCNQSGQLKQVKQITSLIEQKLKKYLINVEKYFKNHSQPQVSYMCKQNRQILQELTENDYVDLERKKKQTYYTGFGGSSYFERTPEKQISTSTFNNRQSSANLTSTNKTNNFAPGIGMPSCLLQSTKYIGEIQIEGNVNGQLQNLSMQISENIQPEIQAESFLNEYNLGYDLKDQIVQQVQQIQILHRQNNTFTELFQDSREQKGFIKELKAKYRFDNNVLFQNIQKSSAQTNNFRVNLELESGKMVRFNFSETDNLPKVISIFCINHKLSAKNQQKLLSICEQSIKYYKDMQQQQQKYQKHVNSTHQFINS